MGLKRIEGMFCRFSSIFNIWQPFIESQRIFSVWLKEINLHFLYSRDFQEYFDKCDKDVVSFANLGGDAHLVVPCPIASKDQSSLQLQNDINIYGHLAVFMALNTNINQLHNLWIKVAETFEDQISYFKENQPIWLSTCGTGVYWLHVRLDSRPKYYSYQKYKHSL